MATVILMDGLGGRPEVTFSGLKIALEELGHYVVLVPVEGIRTHEDRIKRVLSAYYAEQTHLAVNEDTTTKIFLLGLSAGGSAVRIAAHQLSMFGEKQVGGVILVSQAMPRYVWFMTLQLLQSMKSCLGRLGSGQDINTTVDQYSRLVEPISADLRSVCISNRITIPGLEARKLAFYPDRLSGFKYPALVIYGEKDQWISPSAHERLCKKLAKLTSSFTCKIIPGSGHIPLFSERRNEVIAGIKCWIGAQ